jgi:hypothetical protein
MYDLDNMMFQEKEMTAMTVDNNVENVEEKKVKGKKTEEAPAKKPGKPGIGLDVGTGFLVGAGFDSDNKVKFAPLRDAFFTIDKATFNRSMFQKGSMKYVEIGTDIHVIGEDALTLAKIRNTSAKRPLKLGVINPQERNAAPILKEMFRYCVKPFVKKEGEIMVFSVPGAKIGDEGFNVDYHSMSIQSLARYFGLEAVPINEAYAVILAEMEKSEDVTGLGFSFGAGLVNVCFVYKSMLLFEFSIDKSGDFIDSESARACGVSTSVINHIKEKELVLTADEMTASPEIRALIFTYRHVIKNTLKEVVRAFTNTSDVNVIEPVPIIVSGGTSIPEGFMELFTQELRTTQLPFKVTEVLPSENRLAAVAKGCLIWANHLEQQR